MLKAFGEKIWWIVDYKNFVIRVFHVITLSSVGGAQSVVVNLANAQVEGNEVRVIL